jgi:hypothetical protein
MAVRPRENSAQTSTADEGHSTPFSSYIGLAIMAMIALLMIVLQVSACSTSVV